MDAELELRGVLKMKARNIFISVVLLTAIALFASCNTNVRSADGGEIGKKEAIVTVSNSTESVITSLSFREDSNDEVTLSVNIEDGASKDFVLDWKKNYEISAKCDDGKTYVKGSRFKPLTIVDKKTELVFLPSDESKFSKAAGEAADKIKGLIGK